MKRWSERPSTGFLRPPGRGSVRPAARLAAVHPRAIAPSDRAGLARLGSRDSATGKIIGWKHGGDELEMDEREIDDLEMRCLRPMRARPAARVVRKRFGGRD